MNQKEIFLIENDLYKAIHTFYDVLEPSKRNLLIRDYTLEFCIKNNISLDDALSAINHIISPEKRIQKSTILPTSKRGKELLVRSSLFSIINSCKAFGDIAKTEEIILKFCEMTGLEIDFVKPLIEKELQSAQKSLIETVLYPAVNFHSLDTAQTETIPEYVAEFSEAIGATPEFTLNILNKKIKFEKAKEKAAARTKTSKPESSIEDR